MISVSYPGPRIQSLELLSMGNPCCHRTIGSVDVKRRNQAMAPSGTTAWRQRPSSRGYGQLVVQERQGAIHSSHQIIRLRMYSCIVAYVGSYRGSLTCPPRSTRLPACPHAAMTVPSRNANASSVVTSDTGAITCFPLSCRQPWARGVPLPPQQSRNRKPGTSVS